MKNRIYIFLCCIILLTLTFKLSLGQDPYYWVGGQGNWSDINHWATESGGTVLHIQVPTAENNVFFDDNSFSGINDTVFVNISNAVCKNMNWTGTDSASTFAGQDTVNFRIYGSLKFDSLMNQDFMGIFSFESTSLNNTIEMASKQFNNHVYFQGIDGGWKLLDDFTVTDNKPYNSVNIFLYNGTLNTNGQIVTSEGFYSDQQNNRTLNISGSEIFILGSWNIDGTNLDFYSESSLITARDYVATTNGDILQYNNINFDGIFSGLFNDNVYVNYNFVNFLGSGMVEGNCTIDSIIFIGNGVDTCIINGTDSINYARLQFLGRVSGINNVIKKVVFDDYGILSGQNNKVDTVEMKDVGFV
ncbi:MAG: hypothetical protein K8R58_13025, partial [Bacteroidales bacterium]|nr:hypothetical protein [Bacteroidales bacterium]